MRLLRKGAVWRYGAQRAVRKAVAGFMLVFLLASPGAAQVTIAALGDSLTQGYGLAQDKGFVPQLQNWLRDHGQDVAVLNAGVSGDTTAGGLARVDWTLTPDVDAMIVALGGNDILRGLPPEQSRANLDGILMRAGERGVPVLLVGLTAPGNYGPDYKAAFDAMYPELAAKHGALHVESFLAPLEADGDHAEVLRAYLQPDGIHPNADGVVAIVDALGPEVLKLIERVGSD